MNKAHTMNIQKKRVKHLKIVDKFVSSFLLVPTILSASFVLLIILFITERGVSPFIANNTTSDVVNLWRFLSGVTWYQPPLSYGIFFIVINTLYVVFLSGIIAIPISVLTALFIAKMTPKPISKFFQTIIELLASVPSIVFGVFGLGVITKVVIWLAGLFGRQTAGGISTLSTVLVLAMMILPTITLLSITAINAVNTELEKNSLALGASRMQTYFKVTLVSAKSGIFAGIILGIGRALGEATAVSMVAGNAGSGPSFDLFSTTRTLTSTMLLGLKETTGTDYDIRFSVGIILIILIIITNLSLNYLKKKVGKFS